MRERAGARSTAQGFHARFGVGIQQIYGLAELHAICMNRHNGERMSYDSVGKPVEGSSGESPGTQQRAQSRAQQWNPKGSLLFDWEVHATTGDGTAADQLSLRTFWALTVDPSHRKSATMLIVGQQAHGERMRRDDVPRADLADQYSRLVGVGVCRVRRAR